MDRDTAVRVPADAAVPQARPRVVQWATGNIGSYALRGVIDHPGLELVGVYVHSADKVGHDAADLCRPTAASPASAGRRALGATGVTATDDVDRILDLGADCVLYMPRACDFDEVARLLAGGTNVVTTRGEFHRPESLDPAVRHRIEASCAEGGTSVHSTGSSPGFITEAVPLVLSSLQRRLDRLTISEFADLSRRDSPALLFDIMGFGRAPADYSEARLSHGRTSFGPSLHQLADALGLPLDDVDAAGEVAVAREPVTIAAGTIAAGTVAAQRMTVTGLRNGEPLLVFRASWYCSADIEPAWDLRPTGWQVELEGDAPLDVQLRFPVTLDDMAATTPAYTANRAVNAVRVVCTAPPGIRTTFDLPQITAQLGEQV